MALNTWGMPAKVGSEDKELRMEAIGKFIQQKEYDVYLLSELWMRPDHETIRKLVPHGSKHFVDNSESFINPFIIQVTT